MRAATRRSSAPATVSFGSKRRIFSPARAASRCEAGDSNRVVAMARLNGDPALLGELIDRGLAAEAPKTAGFHAAERHLWFIVHGRTVDVTDTAFDAHRERVRALDVAAEDRRREPIFGIVGEGHGFVIASER